MPVCFLYRDSFLEVYAHVYNRGDDGALNEQPRVFCVATVQLYPMIDIGRQY
jgi:hypothetical protein